jgi:hypothetical protein
LSINTFSESAGKAIFDARAEILTVVVALAGWALLTAAVAQVVRPDVVWRVSAALLLLSLVGWKFLYGIVTKGIYVLTRGTR